MIDADAIEYDTWGLPRGNGMYEDEDVTFKSRIDSMPTIEAVPVEWINQYIADDTNGRKIELQHIRRMLEAWGEEFEDDKCLENPRLA